MDKKSYSLIEIKDADKTADIEEYFFNGSLIDSEGNIIYFDRTPIFLNKSEYYSIKRNQKVLFSFEEVLAIFKSVPIIREPKIPFPQADIFEIFIEICEKLYQHKSLSREQIMKMFDINPRQYSFYISAGMYLGLINHEKSKQRSLNQIGLGVFSLDIKERNLAIVKLILQHKPFHDVFRFYLDYQRIPTSDEIFDILKKNKIYNVSSDVTLKRRAMSVRSWIKWIVNLYGD
ncbi:hypothetical protein [Methanobrevibacter sp.]|uniref:DUF7226 domain-containing protein n=1 Tax=Methanobrevibacter sp. TaxID=66852 RepID=UPI0025CC5015|nr:hypothetical protein [Methanobrevibacter sp.]MBQ2962723.1 hypothetical protein [Methanobrevibacter sp.]